MLMLFLGYLWVIPSVYLLSYQIDLLLVTLNGHFIVELVLLRNTNMRELLYESNFLLLIQVPLSNTQLSVIKYFPV